MGISQRQGPIHNFAPTSKTYKDNYDHIFRKKEATEIDDKQIEKAKELNILDVRKYIKNKLKQ